MSPCTLRDKLAGTLTELTAVQITPAGAHSVHWHDANVPHVLQSLKDDATPMTLASSPLGSITTGVPDLPALPTLKRSALRQVWHALFNAPMPAKASRQLLIYCLAYRIQQNAYGGLSAAARRRLRATAQQLAPEHGRAKPAPVRLAPGTRLIRQWREQRHEVTVLERGFAYRGRHYGSLSAIARVISGTHCSGPRFFGLRPASQGALARGAAN